MLAVLKVKVDAGEFFGDELFCSLGIRITDPSDLISCGTVGAGVGRVGAVVVGVVE